MGRNERSLWVVELGLRPYGEIWSLQEDLNTLRWKGLVPDLLLLLEHEPVITLGKSGRAEHIRVSAEELVRRGIALHRVDRGGDVTFHGPGQMVAYPILDLTHHGRDVHLYCRRLEEVGLKVLSDYGVSGQRMPGLTGVWVGEEKVMAIGVGVKRWVSLHGVAFNVNADLNFFRLIHPCGIKDRGITSLSCLLKRKIPLSEVKERWLYHFARLFEVEVQRMSEAKLFEEMRRGRQEAVLAGAKGATA